MKTEELEQLVLLYERLAVERDDRKMMALVQEINRRLKKEEKPPTVN